MSIAVHSPSRYLDPGHTRGTRSSATSSLYLRLHSVYMFLMLGGLIPMIFNGPSDFRGFGDERSGIPTLVYLAVHIIYFCIAILIFKKLIPIIKTMYIPFLLIILTFVTIYTSSDPQRSAIQAVFLFLQLVACTVIFSQIGYRDFLLCLAHACFAAIVLSLILIFLVPSYGRMTFAFPDVWQGIFIHKNVLGRFAVFSFIVFLSIRSISNSRMFVNFGLLGSAVLVIGSESASSIVILMAILLFVPIFLYRKISHMYIIFMWVFAFSVSLVFIFLDTSPIEMFFSSLGRSATLTGRTTIWEQTIHFISLKPWTGYGLGGFWNTESAELLRVGERWAVPNAHNGFLELGLQLGIPGILLYLALILQGIRAGRRLKPAVWGTAAMFAPLFVLYLIGYGVAEASYLRPNSFIQLALYAVIFYGATEGVANANRRGEEPPPLRSHSRLPRRPIVTWAAR